MCEITDLFETEWDRMCYHVFLRCGDQYVAQDLVQDVLYKICCIIARGDKIEKPVPYAWIALRNQLKDYYRNEQRYTTVSLESISNQGSTTSHTNIIATIDDIEWIWKSAHLTPEQEFCIVNRYVRGYSFAEIAKDLNRTEAAVRGLTSRGRYKLRYTRRVSKRIENK